MASGEVFVPAVNAAEASLVSDVDVLPVTTLTQLVQHLIGAGTIEAGPSQRRPS